MAKSEDRELIERARRGDVGAFERLVGKYQRLGGAVAFGVLHDMELAEDVVQEAFLRAYEALGSLRDPDRFRVWFARLVRHRAIDFRRAERPQAALEDLPAEPARETAGELSEAEEPAARNERRERVLGAIAALPEADRTVLVLKHMDGRSYKEIAEITGDTVAAIESRLFRARRLLRAKLDGSLANDV